jgi:hypothetical protein
LLAAGNEWTGEEVPVHKRLHLPSPALVVAIVAVVLALGGVAWAATGQLVNIADPTNASNVAKVNGSGELRVVSRSAATPANTPLFAAGYYPVGTHTLFGPTTATLALDHVNLRNPNGNTSYANTTFRFTIGRTSVTSGTCGTTMTPLAMYTLRPGDNAVDSWPVPLRIKPVGTAPFCVALLVAGDPTNPGSVVHPCVAVQGQVVSGTYTGPGTAALPAPAPAADGSEPVTIAGQPQPSS